MKKKWLICPKCRKRTPYEKQFCQSCLFNIHFWLNGSSTFYTQKIPSWRLNIDDAPVHEVLTRPLKDFGTPFMSEAKWKDYYSNDWEVKKKREVKQMKKELREEGIRELVEQKKKEK